MAAASTSASKGVNDPRLKPYHLLPPEKGPQVRVCVRERSGRARVRRGTLCRLRSIPARGRVQTFRSEVMDLRCLRDVQMTIFRLTLDEDVFNSLKRAGDVSFKMGADGQHILRVGKQVCKRVREQGANGAPVSATSPVPGASPWRYTASARAPLT